MSQPQALKALTPTKTRILEAALELFSTYGVAGTSLQMIADEIGVTKAAVYHQFNTKQQIVIAVGEMVLQPLEVAAENAAKLPVARRRQFLLHMLVGQAVVNKRIAAFLQRDPFMLRVFQEHKRFRKLLDTIDSLLMGKNRSSEAKVTTSLILTAIGGTVMHPLIADMDGDVLRKHLENLVVTIAARLEKS